MFRAPAVEDQAPAPAADGGYEKCKRVLDIFLSFALLLASIPLLAVIALLVGTTSRGPVFFRHRRLGRSGLEFDCWKFRTMVENAEELLREDARLRQEFQEDFKLKDDPRITRIGAFLRKTSLDELPQLLNVLRGEMSLIGPRPIIREELDKYGVYAGQLLSVRPGLSGFWQACGRSETTYTERVVLDMLYIDYRSIWLDLWLLWLTVSAVSRRQGAH